MVHRCCISSCGMNVRVAEAKGLSYHGFPNKEPLREQWIQAIIPHLDKPETFKVVAKYTRVCSRHFRKKDYSVDIKKRARLNSNAVPSVFPRKNSPIVIPNVLSSPSRGGSCSKTIKLEPGVGDLVPTTATTTIVLSTSRAASIDESSPISGSPLFCPVSWKIEGSSSEEGNGNASCSSQQGDGGSGYGNLELFIESATLSEDQLTLRVRDVGGDGGFSSSTSLSQEDDISQGSNLCLNVNEDSNEAPHKKRKRRKWNRSAFDRPAKGKKKESLSADDVNIDGVGEALAEISLSTLLAITTPNLQEKHSDKSSTSGSGSTSSRDISTLNSNSTVSTLKKGSTNSTCLQTVTLSLGNSKNGQKLPPDQVQHLSSIEQELMQSIQAVSLHCGGEQDVNNEGEGDDGLTLNLGTKSASFLHHSSEESIFSTEDEDLKLSSVDGYANLNVEYHSNEGRSSSPAGGSLRIVGLDERGPSLSEIENLANHFNSSLLTGYNNSPINLLIGLEDLHLPDTNTTETLPLDHQDNISTSTASSSSEDINNLFLSDNLNSPEQYGHSYYSSLGSSIIKCPSNNRKKKKAPENVRLTGVTKKHKKEKICGQFSVERFSNSDKDIEYYTGFSSYRNFEAFFRSLEAYVERLRVTDVMFGVANLDKLHSDTSDGPELDYCSGNSSDIAPKFILPLPPPPAYDDKLKRRPFHGRSMSRIDELFMTIIRLRRKLPEKVLGHMFCISQPTVSRIIRAWTVLLSKLIDCYPVESCGDVKLKGGKVGPTSEHSYTSRGLGIPESVRQLFHSELAQSIVVTSVSAKDKKTAQKLPSPSTSTCSSSTTTMAPPPPPPGTAKRSKKSRVEENSDIFADTSTNISSSVSSSVTEQVCDLLDSGSNLLFNPIGLDVEECEIFQQLNFLD